MNHFTKRIQSGNHGNIQRDILHIETHCTIILKTKYSRIFGTQSFDIEVVFHFHLFCAKK